MIAAAKAMCQAVANAKSAVADSLDHPPSASSASCATSSAVADDLAPKSSAVADALAPTRLPVLLKDRDNVSLSDDDPSASSLKSNTDSDAQKSKGKSQPGKPKRPRETRASSVSKAPKRPRLTLKPAVACEIDASEHHMPIRTRVKLVSDSRSRSGGRESTAQTEAAPFSQSQPPEVLNKSVGNMLFATFHVGEKTDAEEFMKMLTLTPMHWIAIVCETNDSAVAKSLRKQAKVGPSQSTNLTICHINEKTFLYVHKFHVHDYQLLGMWAFEKCEVATFKVRSKTSKTAVAVAVVDSPWWGTELPATLTRFLAELVCKDGVRCLTGVFGKCKQQMAALASILPTAMAFPIVLEWEGAAVAADYAGRAASSTRQIMVFPSYTVLFGTCKKVTLAASEKLTSQEQALAKYVPAVADFKDVIPEWPRWTPERVEVHPAGDVCWGCIKTKPFAANRCMPGVHPVAVWVGQANPGQGASATKASKSTAIGKGASKAKGGKKGGALPNARGIS